MFFKHLQTLSQSNLITALFLLILFDILTGNLKAYIWKVNDSSVGFKGILKHTSAFIFYSLIFSFLTFIKAQFFANSFIVLVILNYLISIIENLGVMGVYIPDFLKIKILSEVERYAKQLEQFNLENPYNINNPQNTSSNNPQNNPNHNTQNNPNHSPQHPTQNRKENNSHDNKRP